MIEGLYSYINMPLRCCRYGVINQLVETEYDVEKVAEVKRRFLQLKGCMSIEDFFSGWFHGVPAEEVRRGNVEDFVAYGFYFRTLDGLPPQVLSSYQMPGDDISTLSNSNEAKLLAARICGGFHHFMFIAKATRQFGYNYIQ